MNRTKAREAAFLLIFEWGFQNGSDPAEIYANAQTARDLEDDEYVKDVFFGVVAHREEIDALIEKYSRGWKKERISAVSRALMSLCIYEMMNRPDIPIRASLNEAIELVKKYDDEAAKAFVNGILDAVSKEARVARNEE